MARGNGTTATTTTTPARKPAAANGTPAAAGIKPIPAKVLRSLLGLTEPNRVTALTYIARETGPVSLNDVAHHLGISAAEATPVVGFLKQRGWLDAERIPAGGGGPGWRYRLSNAGRERLMVLGG